MTRVRGVALHHENAGDGRTMALAAKAENDVMHGIGYR